MKGSVKEVLTAAKWILQNVGWTKGALARDAAGEWVRSNEPSATCFCIRGAVSATTFDRRSKATAEDAMRDTLTNGSLVEFNDSQATVKPILALIDRTIRHAS